MTEEKSTPDLRQQVALAEHKQLRHEVAMQPRGRGQQLAPENASQAMTFAQMMARSEAAVPKIFRGNAGLCLGVTMDAMTFGFNPFALARSAYEVGGAIGYEAKIYTAALNNSGFLKKRLEVTYSGEIKGTHKVTTRNGERDAPAGTLVCRVVGQLVDHDEPLEWESPELGKITTKNSPLWYSDPKLQLFYYTVRAWARVHAPEVMLGVQTTDELLDREVDAAPAPVRMTLIEKVKERRAEQAEQVVDVDPETVEQAIEVETNEQESPSSEPPSPNGPAQSGDVVEGAAAEENASAAAPDAPAVQEDEKSEDPILERLMRLERDAEAAGDVKEIEAVKEEFTKSIAVFSNDDQFELQQKADVIINRRKIAIRKAAKAAKAAPQ